MLDCHVFKVRQCAGIEIHIPTDYPQIVQFGENVLECMDAIDRLRHGRILLTQIAHCRVPLGVSPERSTNPLVRSLRFGIEINVIITPGHAEYMENGYFGDAMLESSNPAHNKPGTRFWKRKGSLAASTVPVHPDYAERLGYGSKSAILFTNAVMDMQTYSPPFIILAHELIHAVHNLMGARWDGQEEHRTVGVGNFSGAMEPMVSENQLRREAKLPLRTTY